MTWRSLPGPDRARRRAAEHVPGRGCRACPGGRRCGGRGAADGVMPPLLGIPYALKDIFVTRALDDAGQPRGLPTTAGSRILAGYLSPYASDAEERLTAAGAVLLGKTNCDEFAMGSSNENSAYGPVHNPWDETPFPAGPAAARARRWPRDRPSSPPAPTRRQYPPAGRVERGGGNEAHLRPREPIRDGRLRLVARPVRPVRALRARRGPGTGRAGGDDPRDATCVDQPVPDYLAALTGEVCGLRLGVPREFFVAGMEPGVEQAVRAAIEVSRCRGEIVKVSCRPPTRPRDVLHHHPGRGKRQPGALRWHPLRPTAGVDDLLDNYRLTRGEGFGPRSSAGSSSALTPCRPATTTRITSRPSRSGP